MAGLNTGLLKPIQVNLIFKYRLLYALCLLKFQFILFIYFIVGVEGFEPSIMY